MKIKELLCRVTILLIGLTIAHLGVTLFLLSNLGADPFNVFVQGIFKSFSSVFSFSLLTHGNIHICISVLIILILLIVDRTYIRIGTLLCMICGGPIIDLFSKLLTPLFAMNNSILFRLTMTCCGCIILAMGMTLVIRSDAGTGPNDLVAVVLSDKTHFKFSIIRIIVDFLFALTGFLCGGLVGIGTLVCAFLVGPVAGFFLPRSQRLVKKFLHHFNVLTQ